MSDVLPTAGEARLFRRAQQIGFDGVELILRRDQPERVEAARRAQAETGLAVPSLVLGEHSGRGGVADTDRAAAEAAAADVRRAVDWAVELGADGLLIPFFGRAELHDTTDVRAAAVALGPLCELAADRGVSLLYEGTLPADGVRELVGLVGSAAFGCYFDTANEVVRGRDAATELRRLGGLARRVHVKDVRAAVNDCPPGLGLVDFTAFATALDDIGYEGWVVLETPPGPPELVARDLSFVRTVVAGLAWGEDWPRLGIFSRHADDWETLIDDCRRLGLRAVQLDGPLLAAALERPEDAAVLDEAGIDVAGIGGYRNLVSQDEAERRRNVEFLSRCLELAASIGTSVVATETGTRNREQAWAASPENRSPQALAALDESLGELLEAAERHGSILALEGYVSHVVGTHAALQGVLDRFPTRRLQLVLDPYNYLSRHLLPEQERVTRDFLDRFEHRFVLAHGKDVGESGAEDSTPELGTGVFAQGAYLEFLAERRPDLPLILEHLPLEHVGRASERVRAAAGPNARRARRRGERLLRPPSVSRLAQERVVSGVPVRVITPDEISGVYLHLHGGGFVYGSASLQDAQLERLAVACRAAVVSVDYRLAPEHPYPAAPDDCEAVALWLGELAGSEFGADRVAVGGESAGANLAVVTLLRLRDRHGFNGIRGAALSCGVFDLSLTDFRDADGSRLRDELDRAFAQYAAGAPRGDPDLSPLHAELRDLPYALFAGGALDPLLPDSVAMAERWAAAGSRARLVIVPDGPHGVDTTVEVGTFLAAALAAP
jgi:sugar phosphate isomerase/epimerase